VSARARLVALFPALLLLGCFAPDYDEGSPCSVGAQQCPDGYRCIAGGCWSSGHAPDLTTATDTPPDLAVGDLATPDAASPELDPPDGGSGSDGGVVVLCATQYVAPDGDDARSGCAPETAKRTIYAALDIANRFPDGGKGTVLVCKGNYVEQQLQLRSGVTLRGGYDCAGWTRVPGYGYPMFDTTNETVITNAPSWSPTLRVTGGVVDGVTIHGAALASCSVAVLLRGDAVITNDRIVASGTTCDSGAGSIGVAIDDASGSPLVANDDIHGGAGHSDADDGAGSVAVLVHGGATPHIHDNKLDGGKGTTASASAAGSIGLQILGPASPNPVENNSIYAGDGYNSTGDAARGIYVTGHASVDIIGNSIDGGSGRGTQATAAITAHDAGSIRVWRNRLYGGLSHAPRAIDVAGYTHVEIVNNMIYSGDGNGQNPTGPVGIWLAADLAIIRSNTIIAHQAAGPPGGIPIFITTSSSGVTNQPAVGATIEDNILGTSGGTDGFAISADGCAAQGIIASFSNNVTLNATPFRYSAAVDPRVCVASAIASDDAIAAELTGACTSLTTGACASFGGARATGNLNLRASCTGDSGCLTVAACSSVDGCLAALFSSWDTFGGLPTLEGPGWQLAATTPCAVARSSLDLTALGGEYSEDLFRGLRTTPPSMGADEYDGACQ
jgi:hypothetical protein